MTDWDFINAPDTRYIKRVTAITNPDAGAGPYDGSKLSAALSTPSFRHRPDPAITPFSKTQRIRIWR